MYQIMDSIMKETEGSGRWDVSTVFIRPDGSYLIRRLDMPVARFGLFCGSDDLIATFPCSGLLFFAFPMT